MGGKEKQLKTQDFGVSLGPFSGRINAGLLDGKGHAFTSKQDCTDQCLIAVAQYVLNHDGDHTITDALGQSVRIRVERVS